MVILEFLVRLRDERWFPGEKALIEQMRKDIANARRYFAWLGRALPDMRWD